MSGIHEMGNNGVALICHFNGKLVDADRNARYIGGCTKFDTVPNMIGFTAFIEKIQQMMKLPPSEMEFKIKCGVRFDESTVIAIDVDDDESLQSIMERSQFITAYILKNSPPSSPVVATERLFAPNFNAHHEGTSLTTSTHDVNIQDRMPPSNVDAPPNSMDIDISVGKEFRDVDALRNALSEEAIKTRRVYRPVKTTKSKLVMKCKNSSCDWHIRATRIPNMPTFKVVKYCKEHTCLNHGGTDHRQATVRWIASKIWPSIQNNRDMEPRNIVKEMKTRFGIEISRNKASKSKNMALAGIREALFLRLVKELNEGGDVAKFRLDLAGNFEYLFWAFSASIQALRKNLGPILFIFASRNEIGITLCASGVDGDERCVHVAFGLFSGKDDMAWNAFCERLKEDVLSDTFFSLCSDSFTVVVDFKEAAIHAVRKYFPDVPCLFYGNGLPDMVDNIYGSDVSKEFMFARRAPSHSACVDRLQNIRRISEDAYEWLLNLGLSHWAFAFCSAHSMSALTTYSHNIFDGHMFCKEAIVDIVEHSIKVVGSYFSDRQRVGNAITTKYIPRIERVFEWVTATLPLGKVESIAIDSYEVLHFRESEPHVVDLWKRSCSCDECLPDEFPCRHAVLVIAHKWLYFSQFISRSCTAEAYGATYAGKIPRISDALEWKPATGFLPKTKRGAGRPMKRST